MTTVTSRCDKEDPITSSTHVFIEANVSKLMTQQRKT